jgi:segregation and condensation protein B
MPKEIIFDSEFEEVEPETSQIPELEKVNAPSVAVDQNTRFHLKRVIEALLFASTEPLTFQKIRDITDTIHPLQPRVLRHILQELQEEYNTEQRAFRLEEIAQGFTLRSHEKYSPYIELLSLNRRSEKLTHASTEVLAIIAYRQPITKSQVESIRGVDSSGIISNLLERQLIQPVGKLEAPGRPTLYGITKEFLKHFGLRDVKELPILG